MLQIVDGIQTSPTRRRNAPFSHQVDLIGNNDDGFVDFQIVSDFVEVVFGDLEGGRTVNWEHYHVGVHRQRPK